MYNGIINIYKEKGFTSHDVVAKLRGILHQKKIGQTGTLDPDAEGVLPVCLGRGTKLCDMLTDKDKVYEAELLLGIETDTQDLSGTVLERHPVTVGENEVFEAVMSFLGTYKQIPPMYSAIKVDGRKLYDLARAGQVVERKPRTVTIHDIDILEMKLPFVRMRIHCSKGTYIRTLCHDIGEKLGCYGCMSSLLRTRVSFFDVSTSISLDKVSEYMKEGRIDSFIIPIDRIFETMPAFYDDGKNDKLLTNGNQFPPNGKIIFGEVRVYKENGTFVGIYQYDSKKNVYSPVKIFYDPTEE
ncbi:MAG: tRNA pseudouridine(55) synthase TruB [Thermoflexaceae bacterium]|nr:tRNA pseudouridine(55) synthase TruB [Thermoflexaceae bacterium]